VAFLSDCHKRGRKENNTGRTVDCFFQDKKHSVETRKGRRRGKKISFPPHFRVRAGGEREELPTSKDALSTKKRRKKEQVTPFFSPLRPK